MKRTLYICYFGVREPLVQTQVLPYLREIRKGNIAVSILTFEPGDIRAEISDSGIAEIRESLAAEGIVWHWLAYHKRFSALATAWDILRGAWFVGHFIGREKPDVIHGRVHVSTLMGALGRKFSRQKPKLLFDIRGFFPEEYTDAGVWPEDGWLYKSAKRVERWLMSESDGFVILTEKARELIFPNAVPQDDGGWLTPSFGVETPAKPKDKIPNPKFKPRPVEVIPCCVDFESRFTATTDSTRESTRRELGVDGRDVIVHSGALGGLYLTIEIMDLISAAKRRNPATFALILTQSDQTLIRKLLAENGFSEVDFIVKKVAPSQMPLYLSASDVAVSFVKSGFSTLSRSPTKIPEYLACGLPIIANFGVGDVDDLINSNRIGALVKEFTTADYLAALESIDALGDVGHRCREAARREFDLATVGGVRYRRIYGRLLQSD